MGATPMQIVLKVLLAEALPGLAAGADARRGQPDRLFGHGRRGRRRRPRRSRHPLRLPALHAGHDAGRRGRADRAGATRAERWRLRSPGASTSATARADFNPSKPCNIKEIPMHEVPRLTCALAALLISVPALAEDHQGRRHARPARADHGEGQEGRRQERPRISRSSSSPTMSCRTRRSPTATSTPTRSSTSLISTTRSPIAASISSASARPSPRRWASIRRR